MSILSKIFKPKISMPIGTIRQPKQASHNAPMGNHSYMAVQPRPAKRAGKSAKRTSTVMGIPKGRFK